MVLEKGPRIPSCTFVPFVDNRSVSVYPERNRWTAVALNEAKTGLPGANCNS